MSYIDSIIGQLASPQAEPVDEVFHLMACRDCGQLIDLRDLSAVVHHESMGHGRLPPKQSLRLAKISEQLGATLRQRG